MSNIKCCPYVPEPNRDEIITEDDVVIVKGNDRKMKLLEEYGCLKAILMLTRLKARFEAMGDGIYDISEIIDEYIAELEKELEK